MKLSTIFGATLACLTVTPLPALCDGADKAFPINDHIWMAVKFATNDLGHRDNQVVDIYGTDPSIPAGYKPCANRLRFESPSAAEMRFIEDPREGYGANRYLWVAHNPQHPVVGDSMWVWNANGADVRWTFKAVTGYYLPSQGNNDSRIVECKKATTQQAEIGAPGGLPLGVPPNDDENPHVW